VKENRKEAEKRSLLEDSLEGIVNHSRRRLCRNQGRGRGKGGVKGGDLPPGTEEPRSCFEKKKTDGEKEIKRGGGGGSRQGSKWGGPLTFAVGKDGRCTGHYP